MKAIGILFLYDRSLGSPEKVSKEFSAQFSQVSENLVLEGLVNLPDLKQILDRKLIYWAGVKQDFQNLHNDQEMIGKLAWRLFNDFSGIDSSEDVKSLVYEGSLAPWGFTLIVCVLYNH